MSTDPNRAKSIFLAAAERPAGRRAATPTWTRPVAGTRTCAGEVEALLAHTSELGGLPRAPAPALCRPIDSNLAGEVAGHR